MWNFVGVEGLKKRKTKMKWSDCTPHILTNEMILLWNRCFFFWGGGGGEKCNFGVSSRCNFRCGVFFDSCFGTSLDPISRHVFRPVKSLEATLDLWGELLTPKLHRSESFYQRFAKKYTPLKFNIPVSQGNDHQNYSLAWKCWWSKSLLKSMGLVGSKAIKLMVLRTAGYIWYIYLDLPT